MFSLDEIRERFDSRLPVLEQAGQRMHAAVALVVCASASGTEMLFIERSEHERDPWSGHLGFPGGKIETGDRGPREAAERETREELDLDLSRAQRLGRLDDLCGAHLPVLVSCFVYGLRCHPELTLNPGEVADAFWCPMDEILRPQRRVQQRFRYRGEDLAYPALRLLDGNRPYLWGITYRLVSRFLAVMGRSL